MQPEPHWTSYVGIVAGIVTRMEDLQSTAEDREQEWAQLTEKLEAEA